MLIKVTNLGPLRQAEFELGELTIICGNNNTGKTYATYALFGFLSFWRDAFVIGIPDEFFKQLADAGISKLDLDIYAENAQKIINESCEEYTKRLSRVFASKEKHFENTTFNIELSDGDIIIEQVYDKVLEIAKAKSIHIFKKNDESKVEVSLLDKSNGLDFSRILISRIISDAIKEILFDRLFPKAFIASTERTGAAIFRKELDFARNRLVEQLGAMEKDLNMFELITRVYSDYPLPVKVNVDFTRQLENLEKSDSFIEKNHGDILTKFSDIIGGNYAISRNDGLYFVPRKNKKIKLAIDESSSSVRSLLDIGFYLRHVAEKDDILVIDEPELNLHPENQRRVARLLARLVNLGIKVFITTHSDYIVKEFNTLIMLNNNKPHIKRLMEKEGYVDEELLKTDKLRVYIAEESLIKIDGATRKSRYQTLNVADIHPEFGIEARSFDKTIEDMNRIQEEIVWGDN